jgi:hypothetical protein
MALVIADRVKDSTTTTGTGTVTLSGTAPTGFQNFSVVGNGNTTYYAIAGQSTTEWEVGIGTYTSAGTTLSRTTVLASSNSGSLVTFSGGTKDVFVTYPAGKSVYLDASGTASVNINGTVGATTQAAGAFTTLSATTGITSTRIDPRVSSTASASSVTPTIASYDIYAFTALAAALTINAPTGTPLDGDKLIFRILDNGTSQTLTWNATYTVIGVALPTVTAISKTTYVGCIYNAAATRWDVIAVSTQI